VLLYPQLNSFFKKERQLEMNDDLTPDERYVRWLNAVIKRNNKGE